MLVALLVVKRAHHTRTHPITPNTQHRELEEQTLVDVSLLRALIDGLKIRVNELRKETYEFRRDIMQGAVVCTCVSVESCVCTCVSLYVSRFVFRVSVLTQHHKTQTHTTESAVGQSDG